MANIEFRKQFLDTLINLTDKATSFFSKIDVSSVVSTLSSMAQKAADIGLQLASGIVGMIGDKIPGASTFLTLAQSAVQGMTQLGQSFMPSIVSVLQKGILPNTGKQFRDFLVRKRESLDTGVKLDVATELKAFLNAALQDFGLIFDAASNGVSKVDTGSLLGLADQALTSLGVISGQVDEYANNLNTMKEQQYLIGVTDEQTQQFTQNIQNTVNEETENTEKLQEKLKENIEKRESTDKVEGSKIVEPTKSSNLSDAAMTELRTAVSSGALGTPSKVPVEGSLMLRYKDGKIDNFMASVDKVNTNGTFTVQEVSGLTNQGPKINDKTYNTADCSNGDYIYYIGRAVEAKSI